MGGGCGREAIQLLSSFMTDIRATLRARLDAAVGNAQVLTAPADIAPYLTDWRGRFHGNAQAVVRPGSTREVADVVRACSEARVAIVAQGGNTGQCGGATPEPGSDAVVISLARMNRIREIDAENATLTAEAGATLM
jgi:FAD/FMN-containing dehydrogenase